MDLQIRLGYNDPHPEAITVRESAIQPTTARVPVLDGSQVRDPRAATAQTTWRASNWGMEAQWNATDALRWAYYANTYVFACIRAVSQDGASLPLRAGADPNKPLDFNVDSPLARLLGPAPGSPNPTTSPKRLWGWTIAQRIVAGRWAWEIEYARDQVVGLWPLMTSHLRPVPSNGGSRYFDGYQFTVQGRRVDLPYERVYYDWNPNQEDYREPESALQAARLDISVAVMQDRYDWAFLKNDARPSAVIVHEAFEEQEQKVAWRRQFLESHQGPDNAGRVAWAEAKDGSPKDSLFIQQLGLSQADAQFIPRYEAKVRAICVALGVPLSRLGDASKRTFSNADRETLNYWHDTVKPVMDDFADSINTHLAPKLGQDVCWFDYSGVEALRAKPRWTAAEGTEMVGKGVISKDEHRAELGLQPLPDGEGEAVEAIVPPPLALPVAPPEPPEAPESEPRVVPLRQVRSARGEVSEFVAHEQAIARRTKLWHQTNRTVESLEGMWRRRIQNLFNDQRDSIVARLEGKRGRQLLRAANPEEISNAYNTAYWVERTKELAVDLYEAVTQSAGVALSVALGIDFDLDAPYAQGFIEARANHLAWNVNDTTYAAIKEQLADGAGEGESIPDLAKRIRTLFDQTYKNRAKTVARTEVISAYNGSVATVANEVDQIGGLEWVATRDNRVRSSHEAMDGSIIRKGGAFALDGAYMAYPGDPDVTTVIDSTGSIPDPGSMIVNCRCTIAPVLLANMPDGQRMISVDLVQQAAVALAMARCSLGDAVAMLAS